MGILKPISTRFFVTVVVAVVLVLLSVSIFSPKNIGPATIGPAFPDESMFPVSSPAADDSENNIEDNESAQEKIVIALPYGPSQPAEIVPMGETIYHPQPQNPEGHPGIDFQWDLSAPIDIIACYEGEVLSAEKTTNHNKWDVYIKSRGYTTAYTELETIDAKITKGAKVVLGQRIGEPGKFNNNHYNMHWELRLGTKRVCPMSYFDPESRARIEKDWANTKWTDMKVYFPDICSGKYKEEL